MFSSVFETFSQATCSRTNVLVVQKVLVGETVLRHSIKTAASPTVLVLHYHCLNNSCVGLHEDISIGAAIFPSATKYLSEATLVEFPQGLQKSSISNPRLALVEW